LYVAEASTMLWALQLAVTNFSTISLKGMQRCIDACNGKSDECSWICLQSDMMSNFLYCVLLVLFLIGFEGKQCGTLCFSQICSLVASLLNF
jgi:hypothetical protein